MIHKTTRREYDKLLRKPKFIFDIGSSETAILMPPPIGHAGCYATIDPIVAESGDIIHFTRHGSMITQGSITHVELPGSCVRPDMLEFVNWHKIHWVPVSQILSRRLGIKTCPSCSKRNCKVCESRSVKSGNIVRIRQCEVCGAKWSTIETFVGVISGKTSDPNGCSQSVFHP